MEALCLLLQMKLSYTFNFKQVMLKYIFEVFYGLDRSNGYRADR